MNVGMCGIAKKRKREAPGKQAGACHGLAAIKSANAQIVTIAGTRLEPSQTAADVGKLDAAGASQLAKYIGTNVALVKLTFVTPRDRRVVLAADVVEMNLSNKRISPHGARIIASFLPRWCVSHATPSSTLRAFECCKPLLHLLPAGRETNAAFSFFLFFQHPPEKLESDR